MRYVYRFGAAFLTAGMAPDNLAIDEKGCRVAPAKLLPQQRSNFAEIFEVMAVTTKTSSRRGSAAPRFVADVKTRPEIKLGICGEHGGDPASIAFCEKVGLDYVSASPYPIPAARLAAAQAALCKNT